MKDVAFNLGEYEKVNFLPYLRERNGMGRLIDTDVMLP
jgi:hypothetical protein